MVSHYRCLYALPAKIYSALLSMPHPFWASARRFFWKHWCLVLEWELSLQSAPISWHWHSRYLRFLGLPQRWLLYFWYILLSVISLCWARKKNRYFGPLSQEKDNSNIILVEPANGRGYKRSCMKQSEYHNSNLTVCDQVVANGLWFIEEFKRELRSL